MNAGGIMPRPAAAEARGTAERILVEYKRREGARGAVPDHSHGWAEWKLVTGGTAFCRTCGGTIPLSRGTLLYIGAGQPHGWAGQDGSAALSYYAVRIARGALPRRIENQLARAGEVLSAALGDGDLAEALHIFGMMQRAGAAEYSGCGGAAEWMGLLVGLLLRNLREAPLGSAEAATGRAIRYIESNYAGRVTLEDAARHVCLSATYFSTLFARTAGMSFTEYLRAYRLKQAKRMLLLPGASVAEVAECVGFHSPAYFIKTFSAAFGMTPGEYRRSESL